MWQGADAFSRHPHDRLVPGNCQAPDRDAVAIIPCGEDGRQRFAGRLAGGFRTPQPLNAVDVLRFLRRVVVLHDMTDEILVAGLWRAGGRQTEDDEPPAHCKVKWTVMVISTATGWPFRTVGV